MISKNWSIFADCLTVLSREDRAKTIEDNLLYNLETGDAQCIQCMMKFRRKDQYRDHFEAHHLIWEGYPCKYCNERFKNKNLRRNHYHRSHKEEHTKRTLEKKSSLNFVNK